jgi:multiple sugar transport system substrate-binding protein
MAGRLAALTAAAALFLGVACARTGAERGERLLFWGLGREGEVARELIPEFQRRNPGIRLEVQQIPWTSAHEKLLTAFVGRATPDVAQMGNTWIPEFAAIGALEPLDSRVAGSAAVSPADYFPGVWQTSEYGGAVYGIPWYVDTRVLFYRPDLLARAGYAAMPRDWAGWLESMRRIRQFQPPEAHPFLLPINEWEQICILGLQRGADLLCDDGTRGCFEEPAFEAAANFYVSLYREGLSPIVAFSQLGNVYQEFERGNIAMWMTGPWNLGEFRRRLPPEHQDLWMTAPLPAPDAARWPGASFAGGSSLALFASSPRRESAWKLVEFLSEPAIQSRFYALSGDLPARRAAWEDPSLAADLKARAFRDQLEHVTPMPRVPEWEQIAQKLWDALEPAVRGRASVAKVLAALDGDVNQILEKRRWMLAHRSAIARR